MPSIVVHQSGVINGRREITIEIAYPSVDVMPARYQYSPQRDAAVLFHLYDDGATRTVGASWWMPMVRTQDTGIRIEIQKLSYQVVITIDLSGVDISIWCLNLCLLHQELVDKLLFRGPVNLSLRINQSPDEIRRTVVSISPKEVALSVHPVELGYWVSFFLQYYRDGAAPVDHIDVEAAIESSENEEAYVIFTVKDALPSLSAKEARRIIGSYD